MRRRIKATRLDRAIAVVSPGWASRRLLARAGFTALAGGYTGARRDRRATRTWTTRGATADADIIPDLAALRERSRDLARNIPIASGAINRVCTNVVGSGLRVQPQIDPKILGLSDDEKDKWERAAEAEWLLWAESREADASGCQDFYGLQELAFRAVLESGDTFVVKRMIERTGVAHALALQFIEADQVSTPHGRREGAAVDGTTIVGGVETDAVGRAVAYHVQKTHPGHISGRVDRTWMRLPARDAGGRPLVNHLFDKTRIGQTRGVPYLAPVIEALKQLGTYSEAELMAAVIGAMITVVYKGSSGQSLPNVDPTAETGARVGDKDYRMAAGTVLEIEHDDDVEVPKLGRPNAEFDPFFVAIVRQIGAALELPFEVLIQHFTASYSASRAALETAWQFFRKRRIWLARHFCQPAYEQVIMESIALGRLSAPGFFADPLVRKAWLGAEWIGPARISIDPARENKAHEIAQDQGWETAGEITAALTGGSFERKHERRRREVAARVRDGLQVPPGQPKAAGAAPAPAVEPMAPPDPTLPAPPDIVPLPIDAPENETEQEQ